MSQFVQLNSQLRVRAADILSLQENGNGSTTVTLSRDLNYTVNKSVDEVLTLIEAASTPALTPVPPVANDPQPAPALVPQPAPTVDLGSAGDVVTIGSVISPITPGFDSAALQASETQRITADQQS